MPFTVDLPQADHVLSVPIVHWSAEFVDAIPPMVELLASIESGPRQTSAPIRGQTATSLAVRMDALVAIRLYEQLGDLIRSMGWQQHIGDGRPI